MFPALHSDHVKNKHRWCGAKAADCSPTLPTLHTLPTSIAVTNQEGLVKDRAIFRTRVANGGSAAGNRRERICLRSFSGPSYINKFPWFCRAPHLITEIRQVQHCMF
jgi:hypothetical protein